MMQSPRFERLRPHLLPVLLLLAATAAVYGRALGHEFLTNWDDHLYVTGNRAAQGFSPEHLRMAFTRFFAGNYAPLQIISYMVDYTIWGMRPAGYILANILLHALNGLLLYLLALKMTGRRLWAGVASFLFLVHPVQVESVAWISQRKNLLAMLFFLVALLLYVDYGGRGRQRGALYLGSLAAFVLALLAKSVAVVLPPALVLYDLCYGMKGEWKRRLPEKLPYAVAAVAVGVLAVISQSPEYHGGRVPYHGGSPWTTFLTMLPVLVRYLAMLFWPAGLSALYDPPVRTGIDAAVAGSALLAVLLVVVGVFLYRRPGGRPFFFGYSLFFLGLLPVSQIVPLVTLMNDRYLYFPMVGAAFVGGGLATLALDKAGPAAGNILAAALGVLFLLLLWLSYGQVGVWRDSISLWSDAAAKTPGRKNIWKALGESYDKNGMRAEALASYRRALAIDPDYCEALNNVGILQMKGGDLSAAQGSLERVTRKCPTYVEGFQNLGHALYNGGRTGEAEAAYLRALKLDPRSTPSLMALGNVSLKKGDLPAARAYFTRARAIAGDDAEIAYDLACLEALSGNSDEALRQLETAVRLGFRYPELLKGDPYLASLRSRPEFGRLLAASGGGGGRP